VEEGICAPPVYLPEWFIDIDRLNAIATHSVTMNRFSLPSVTRYYAARRREGRAPGELVGALRAAADTEERPAPAGADEGDLGE
jgi:hypothetical protein